jgi:phenylpyruvate tautomerase PptA (4-oxalocrotonate tautomerase family)
MVGLTRDARVTMTLIARSSIHLTIVENRPSVISETGTSLSSLIVIDQCYKIPSWTASLHHPYLHNILISRAVSWVITTATKHQTNTQISIQSTNIDKMPMWQIYHPPGVFEDAESKAALAADITKMYTNPRVNLPAFYVVVHFNTLQPSNVYVGGVSKASSSASDKPFIRIVIKHIAIRLDNKTEVYRSTAGMIDQVLKPHVYDKDMSCEYHVEETERRLWKFDGMIPPEHLSEVHMKWVEENKPSVYEGAYWSPEKGYH